MANCRNCDRELIAEEKDFCPACKSSKSHKIKKIIEVGTPIAIAILGIVFKLRKK